MKSQTPALKISIKDGMTHGITLKKNLVFNSPTTTHGPNPTTPHPTQAQTVIQHHCRRNQSCLKIQHQLVWQINTLTFRIHGLSDHHVTSVTPPTVCVCVWNLHIYSLACMKRGVALYHSKWVAPHYMFIYYACVTLGHVSHRM